MQCFGARGHVRARQSVAAVQKAARRATGWAARNESYINGLLIKTVLSEGTSTPRGAADAAS